MTEIILKVPNEIAKEMEEMQFIDWNEVLVKNILLILSERDIVESILMKSKMTEEDVDEIDQIVKRDLFEKYYGKAKISS